MEQHVTEAIDTFMTRVRRDLEAHLRTLSSDLIRFAEETRDTQRAELERAVGDARADAERSIRARLEGVRAELTREMDARLVAQGAELEVAKEDLRLLREGHLKALERLLATVRRIDEAASLSGILEALAKGAAAVTSRIAILLVEGETLRTWGHFGFAASAAPGEVPIGQTGVLASAVALRQTSPVPPLLETREPGTPAFMRVPAGCTAQLTPIVVAGDVVALLYADDVDRLSEQEDGPIWTEELELLARHASIRLENVTSERTVELLTRPA